MLKVYKRFHLQLIQMVNKTSSFKTKLIGNNVEHMQSYPQYLLVFNYSRLPVTNYCSANPGQRSRHPQFKTNTNKNYILGKCTFERIKLPPGYQLLVISVHYYYEKISNWHLSMSVNLKHIFCLANTNSHFAMLWLLLFMNAAN